MRINKVKRITSWFLCTVLIVAMALGTIGCGAKNKNEGETSSKEVETTERVTTNILGEGQTKFFFEVIDAEGCMNSFEIHTDKTTVGEALLELNMITGEEGEFGLYVKTVYGIVADYAINQTYWAFYVNGEYASLGVDATTIEEGATYAFKVEK